MEFQSVLSAVYSIFILASLFGNSMIIHIIRTNNSMKTTTNYLILNQACGDLYRTLVELINIAFRSMGNKWFGGFLGLITCKLFLANLFLPTIFCLDSCSYCCWSLLCGDSNYAHIAFVTTFKEDSFYTVDMVASFFCRCSY